jgi:CBS domain-containing protein
MGRIRVRHVVTVEVVAVGEDKGYQEIAELLADLQIGAVPVTDEYRHVVGVVSEADLLAKVEFEAPFPAAARLVNRRRAARAKAVGNVARDLMSAPAVTIEPELSVVAAARKMNEEQVKWPPVVGSDGVLMGVVSRRDLLRGHLRPDPEICDAVLSEVFWEWFRLMPPDVSVTVHEGVVTLAGELERRRQAALAVRLAHGVDGVVDVVDRLVAGRRHARAAGMTGQAAQ